MLADVAVCERVVAGQQMRNCVARVVHEPLPLS
jgi:hypothetical protein